MSDPLQIHHEQQRSYSELRTEFREEALNSLRVRLRKTAIIRDSKGDVIGSYSMLDEKHTMEEMYDHPQNFGLESVPSTLTERLYDKADETETFEAISLPAGEGTDHDAAPLLQPIEMYTDIELINYVDSAIAASKEKP